MKRFATPVIAVVLVLALTACATNDPNRRAKVGAAIGAVAGAVLGHQLDDDSGRFVGAAVGALTGAAVGNYMDKQQQEFEQALAEEQRANAVEIERINNTLKVDISSEASFDVDSAEIKPAFAPTLKKVADLLRSYNNTIVHVVGHTDSTGSDAYNLALSRRRAESVQAYFSRFGVAADRILTEGRGETEPRADNTTAAGRQLNRRVELYVKPVVEGSEAEAYEAP